MPEETVKDDFGFFVECPSCAKPAKLTTITHSVEWFGELLFNSLSCSHCGFRWNDVLPTHFDGKATKYWSQIDSEKDLSVKIMKSSTTTIRIPQIGVEIEPGPASDGYITNIEGLLDRVQGIIEQLERGADDLTEKARAISILEEISDYRAGKKPFVVEVLDPHGNGRMVGNNVKKKELTEEEIALLKKPIPIIDSIR